MERDEEIKTIVGIALLYTIITSMSSLVNRLAVLIPQSGFKKVTDLFLQGNALWIIVVTGIIVILNVYAKKLNQKLYSDILQNRVIRLITGVLVALDGLIKLSSLLPLSIMSVKSSFKMSQQTGINVEGIVTKFILSNVISVVIILFQIFLGIYLVKFYKKNLN